MNSDIFLQSQSDPIMFEVAQISEINQNFDILEDIDFKEKYGNSPPQLSTIIQTTSHKQKEIMNINVDEKKHNSLLAGKKAREKKKKYIETLQQQTQKMQKQLERYDQEIKKTKEILSQTLALTRNQQNYETYSQLKLCIDSQDPNLDKINLLIDMVKFRLGAVGHERQAKIQYNFKQLISLIFPAAHRYLMYCSDNNIDIFQQKQHNIEDYLNQSCTQNLSLHSQQNSISTLQSKKDAQVSWSRTMIQTLDMTQKQRKQMFNLKYKYQKKNQYVRKIIKDLKQIKENIRVQQTRYQSMIDEMRSWLTPVQGGILVLQSEKFKYKREINMQGELQIFYSSIEETKTCFGPTKKRKTD